MKENYKKVFGDCCATCPHRVFMPGFGSGTFACNVDKSCPLEIDEEGAIIIEEDVDEDGQYIDDYCYKESRFRAWVSEKDNIVEKYGVCDNHPRRRMYEIKNNR
jgi:hypothetical protein